MRQEFASRSRDASSHASEPRQSVWPVQEQLPAEFAGPVLPSVGGNSCHVHSEPDMVGLMMDFRELVFRCVADGQATRSAANVRNNPVCRRMRKVMSKVPLLLPYCSSNASLPKNEEARKWSNGLDHLISSPCKLFTLFSSHCK